MTAGLTSGRRTITIAEDFSRYPGGRFREDGDASGEEFREDFLRPALSAALSGSFKISIVLDGAAGYPASFLEEAFGGLVRHGYFTKKQLRDLMAIEAGALFDTYRSLVWKYIDQAEANK